MENILEIMKTRGCRDRKICFDEYLSDTGVWSCCAFDSDSYDYCIEIAQDSNFRYYLCFDEDDRITATCIYRKRL